MNQDPSIYKSRNHQLLIIPEMDQIQLDPVLILPSKPFIAFHFCLNKIERMIKVVFLSLLISRIKLDENRSFRQNQDYGRWTVKKDRELICSLTY